MPIKVSYQPRMSTLARASYSAGLGQFMQRQQQMALQEGLRRDAMQQRAFENAQLNQYRQQQLQLQQAAQQRLMDQQAHRQMLDNDKFLLDQELANERLANDKMRTAAYMRQLDQNDPMASRESLWQQASAKMADAEANGLGREFSKLELNEEGERKRAQLLGELRAIQSVRSSARPDEYSKTISQWMQKAHETDLQGYEIEVPSPEQVFNERAYRVDGNTYATVDEKGNLRFQNIDRDDNDVGLFRNGPEGEEQPQDLQPVTFYDYIQGNPKEYEKMLADAEKSLLERAKSQVAEGSKATPLPPSAEAIYKRAKDDFEKRQKVMMMAHRDANKQAKSDGEQQRFIFDPETGRLIPK